MARTGAIVAGLGCALLGAVSLVFAVPMLGGAAWYVYARTSVPVDESLGAAMPAYAEVDGAAVADDGAAPDAPGTPAGAHARRATRPARPAASTTTSHTETVSVPAASSSTSSSTVASTRSSTSSHAAAPIDPEDPPVRVAVAVEEPAAEDEQNPDIGIEDLDAPDESATTKKGKKKK